jgi:hypothetical protein
MKARGSQIAFLGSAMLFATTSRAAGADPAQVTFDRGVADMERGRFERACPSIEESYKLDPRPGTLFTLAECEAGRGRLATALKRYRDYLAFWTALPADKRQKQGDRAETARRQQVALLPLVPELTLALSTSAPSGTLVIRDGEVVPAAALRVPSPVDPGEHVVTAQAPGGSVTEVRITVAKGEKRSVVLEVRVAEVSPSAPAERPVAVAPLAEAGTSGQRIGAFVVGSAGLAGVVVGAIAGGVAVAKKSVVDKECGLDGIAAACTADGKAAADSLKAFGTVSTVGIVLGLAGVVAGVSLFTTAPKAKAKAAGKGLRVRPEVLAMGPRGAALGVQGGW